MKKKLIIGLLACALLLSHLTTTLLGSGCDPPCTGCQNCEDGVCVDRDYLCPDCHYCYMGTCIPYGDCGGGCPTCESCVSCWCQCTSECCEDADCPDEVHYSCIDCECICDYEAYYTQNTVIDPVSITSPTEGESFCVGTEDVSATCTTSTDSDIYHHCVDNVWTEEPWPDPVTHSWSGAGTFEPTTGTSVTWTPPTTADEYIITVTASDSHLYDDSLVPENPDPTHSVTVYVVEVEIVSVDAGDPFNTKINYRTNPLSATIPSVTFTAPGKTDSKTNVSGNFYFTYDQRDVGWGSNTIRLAYLGTHVDCSVTKTEKLPEAMEVLSAYFAVEGVGLRLYNHTLRETYDPHVYSVAYSGKTIRTCHSIALMDFRADYYNICVWSENHRYSWNGGETSWVAMTPTGGWLPPNTRARECNTVMWCIPNSLEGIAKCVGLLWDYGGGTTPAIITNAEVDRSMPE